MSRFAAFWEEFWKSISWTTDIPEKSEKLKKVVPFVLWLLAVIGYGTKDVSWASWWPWLQPWSPLLLAAIVWFVAWKAAVAWYKTRGPVIWMGGIEPVEGYRFFQFRVENQGGGVVIVHAYATDLCDRHGTRIDRIDDEKEVHYRGYTATEKVKLFGDKHVHAAFLQVNREGDPELAQLILISPGNDRGTWGVDRLVTHRQTPLKEQHKMYLSLRVDFYDCDESKGDVQGKFLTSKTRKVVIIPDKRQPLLYRVRPARWLWE
jgi:hypothetical protein